MFGGIAAIQILEKMNGDINEDPNYNYDIIHNTLVTLKQKYLPSKKIKFNKRKHKFPDPEVPHPSFTVPKTKTSPRLGQNMLWNVSFEALDVSRTLKKVAVAMPPVVCINVYKKSATRLSIPGLATVIRIQNVISGSG